MRKDKKKAVELRRAGKSYKEIQKILGVPLGTLSYWFKNERWSKQIEDSLQGKQIEIRDLHRIRKEELAIAYAQARAQADRDFRFFKNSALFLAGIVAYSSEGDKTSPYSCRFSSSDPAKIRLYLTFLTAVCNVPASKITASLLLYPDVNESDCRVYWESKTGLKQGYFRKSMITKTTPKTRRLQHGICNVTVSSRYLKEKMLVWLSLLSEEFPKMRL